MDELSPGDPARLGDYTVVGRLGAGGMGVVYRACAQDGATVAIKVIRPELAQDPGFRQRFAREIATLRRVDNQHIVRVLDADDAADQPWFVMEHLDGESLEQRVSRDGPLPDEDLLLLARALADALRTLHTAGLLHRDVKPANILMTANGVKLIDFGIARPEAGTALTTTSFRVGSPAWMAPEQVTGDAVTSAIDIFAFGAVIMYAATGRPPFGEGEPEALLYRVVHMQPDTTGFPEPLRTAVRLALTKDPDVRPAATQLRAMLLAEQAGAAAPNGATRILLADSAAAARTSDASSLTQVLAPVEVSTSAPARGRFRRRGAVAAVLVAAALVGAAPALSRSLTRDAAVVTPVAGGAPAAPSVSAAAATAGATVPAPGPALTTATVPDDPTPIRVAPVTRAELNRLVTMQGCDDGVEIGELLLTDFTGDGVKDAFVEASCIALTSSWPSAVMAYAATANGARLVDVIIDQNEGPVFVDNLKWADGELVVGAWSFSSNDLPNCCPDQHWSFGYTLGRAGFTESGDPHLDCEGEAGCDAYRELE